MKKRRELVFSHAEASFNLIYFETAKNIRRCKMAILFFVSPCAVADATGCLTIESNHFQSRESGIAPLIIHPSCCGSINCWLRSRGFALLHRGLNGAAASRLCQFNSEYALVV
jgi:hypothetical protein